MKRVGLFFLLLLCTTSARACFREDNDGKDEKGRPRLRFGDVAQWDDDAPTGPTWRERLESRVGRADWEWRATQLRATAERVWDFRTQNNLTVALAHIGQLDEALERMQAVERTFPGHPYTAYNMGTVYELKGNPRLAYEWIQKGIEREVKMTGHSPLDGTEWLHLRILKGQISGKVAQTAGVDFGDGGAPIEPTNWPEGNLGHPQTRAEVQNSVFEQLHERLEFVKKPTPVVGSLLFDFANLVALNGEKRDAKELYQMALDYGLPESELAQKRLKALEGGPNYSLYAALLALAAGCALGSKIWLQIRAEREWIAQPLVLADDAQTTSLKKRSPKVVLQSEPLRGVTREKEI